MLSTVVQQAFSFSEPGLVNQLSGFRTGSTPWEWDCSDLFSMNQAVPSPCYAESETGPAKINSGYHDMKIGSHESQEQNNNRKKLCQPEITDERKRKRMESNRESAKRSRMRKQSHINDLRNQVNRLDLEKRKLENQLRFVLHQLQRVNTDNNRLLTEQEILRLRLSEMRQILIVRQLQQQQQWELHNRRMIEQNPSSIIDQLL